MPYLDYTLLAIMAWGLVTAGAPEPWAAWPLALAAAAVGGLALLHSRRQPGWALPAAFALLIGATAFQLVPISRPLILHYSPATDAFLQRTGSGYEGLLWGDPPPTHSLSLNPDATLVGLLLLGAFAVLLAGVARALTSRQMQTLARGLPVLGAVAALFIMVRSLGPSGQDYLERDRLTGWLLLVFPMAVVSVSARIGPKPDATVPGGGRSRSGRERGRFDRRLAAGAIVLMAIALAWAASHALVSVADGSTTALWASRDQTWKLIRDFRPAGTGLNTFGTAMLVFQPVLHPAAGYNSYLQFAAEGGLLLIVPAVLALAIFVRQASRRLLEPAGDRAMRAVRLAALAGLALVAVYELAGLSLQTPGNAALFAVVAGMAVATEPRATEPRAVSNG